MNWSSLSLFAAKPYPLCKGKIAIVTGANESFQQLPLNRIIVLQQGDMDEEQAQELIDRRVKAVVHCGKAMSGVNPTQGPLLLLQHHIQICEVEASQCENIFLADTEMTIYQDCIQITGRTKSIPCRAFTREDWLLAQQSANEHVSERWEPFIEHTFAYAMRERQAVREPLPCLPLRTQFEGRHILVVSDGAGYKKDLHGAKGVIAAFKPILVGVGKGADALLASGYKPDIVVGDANQISKRIWESGAEVIIHTYPNGQDYWDSLLSSDSKACHILPCRGNSEDAALLLAHEKGGEWLITVGVQSHMSDFLAKGREDMGSALLVRMKVGARLVDIKSLQALQLHPKQWGKEAASTLVLSCVFIGISLFQLHWILKRAAHVVWRLVGAS